MLHAILLARLQTKRSNDTLDFCRTAIVNRQGLTNGRSMTSGFHQSEITDILVKRMGRLPRGRSCFSWRSTLLPMAQPTARESDLTVKESAKSPSRNLMQEGGGIEPHRAVTRLTAYKAVSTPNGLRLPKKSRALSRPALVLLSFRFGCTGREAEGFQPVIGRIDYATVF